MLTKIRQKMRERKYEKLMKALEQETDQVRKTVSFIVEQEQPMINTLTGHQKEIEEAKLKQKIQKITAKNHKKIEKIKEELEKMVGKMKLEDGKLIKVDSEQQASREVPTPPPGIAQQQMPPQPAMPVQAPQPSIDQHAPQMMEQYVAEQQQPFPPPQMEPRPQQPVPQAQQVPTPQLPPEQQLPETVKVTIRILEGQALDVGVPRESFAEFVQIVNDAIDNQSVLQVGNQVLNGRYIMMYSF